MTNLRAALETLRNFRQFPIGTVVVYQGKKHKTESHAGMMWRNSDKNTPCVFISRVVEPVPLDDIEIPKEKA